MKGSIRKRMILMLVLVLGSITLARIGLGIYQARTIAEELYDQQLANSADSCAARLLEKNGVFETSLPPETLATFTHGHEDHFYYEIFDEGGNRIAGNTDMLKTAYNPETSQVHTFSSTKIMHEPFRLLQSRIKVPESSLRTVTVVAAETMHARSNLAKRIITSMVAAQLLVIIASIAMVMLVTNAVFAPLAKLRKTIINRSPSELSPIDDSSAPEDVQPLITAINELLMRSRTEIESRNRFIANAAHQLRTPIAGLKTYSSFGLRLTELNEMQDLVKKLDTGLDRVTHLMNQLLAMARVEHLKLAPCDLSTAVLERLDEYRNLAQDKEIELEFIRPQGEILINGDSTGLRDLIANLVENALRYTNKKGRVQVRLVPANGYVSLIVEDNGTGIPPAERERVFERFYRVPGTTGDGCGLGLSIVWEVVLAHKAKITIETPADGQGTIVKIDFPLSLSAVIAQSTNSTGDHKDTESQS